MKIQFVFFVFWGEGVISVNHFLRRCGIQDSRFLRFDKLLIHTKLNEMSNCFAKFNERIYVNGREIL